MKAKTDSEACDLLDSLVIASPCSVPWDSMRGDDRKRLCGGCSRHVHNISDMTKSEAESFLRENGTSHCMIFYRRSDGTVMTDDCPVGLRKIRNACRLAYKITASFIAILASAPLALAQQVQVPPSNKKGTIGSTKNADGKVQRPAIEDQSNQKDVTSEAKNARVAMPGGAIMIPPQPPVMMPAGLPAMPHKSNATGTGTKTFKWDTCNTPDLLIKNKKQTSVKSVRSVEQIQPAKVSPEPVHYNLDKTAQTFYEKGLAISKAGNKSLASFYFEKALDAFDQQKNVGDPKFREELTRSIARCQN